MGNEQRAGVYDVREGADLGELLAKVDRNVRVTIRTATVGAVAPSNAQPLGYDPITQLCSVLVQQRTVTTNPDIAQGANSVIVQPPVLLVNVPVKWTATGKGKLTMPLNVGDTGELIVQDRSLAEWRKKGVPVDPIDNWTHNRGDAVFHPGLHSDRLDKRLTPTDQTATVLDGELLVKIGELAADFPIKGTSLAAVLAPVIATLAAVPPPVDLVTAITAIEANTAALLAFMNAITATLATKVMVE